MEDVPRAEDGHKLECLSGVFHHGSRDRAWNCRLYSGKIAVVLRADVQLQLCACIPHIKPLAKRWLGRKKGIEQHAAEQRLNERKSAPSPDAESLDFITEASPPR